MVPCGLKKAYTLTVSVHKSNWNYVPEGSSQNFFSGAEKQVGKKPVQAHQRRGGENEKANLRPLLNNERKGQRKWDTNFTYFLLSFCSAKMFQQELVSTYTLLSAMNSCIAIL